ncbi:hypothetical protein [Ramlibacter albus]|uniref:Uncharacterized protein n=1 Tax=Ramlibacter albus TaxID=2079448 RepID=A0A923M8X2_9BURK|nr:hypothetical protein [Ramlibacter albus]MBC5765978.1 hypothetical protein [Ramlibacter albus]
MVSWKQSLRDGALAGSIASILSAAVLLTHRKPAAPVNAISHWVWGDPALAKDKPSWRHTAVGYLIHHAASLFWSTLHARAWGKPRSAPQAVAQAAVTAATAAFVDYKLTPHRSTPGFEHRLTRGQLTAVYVMFAVGLALGSRRFRR